MKRILAVDYGERRTGLAISDELGFTAQGLDTLTVKDQAELPALVAQCAREYDAGTIVLGLPLNMNGSESEKSEKVRAFGATVEDLTGVPVVFWDERMTSLQAQRVMQEMDMKTRGNKGAIDRIAATLILQEYLKSL